MLLFAAHPAKLRQISARKERKCRRLVNSVKMCTASISVGSVSNGAAAHIAKLAKESISTRGRFAVAISGGSLPRLLAEGLQSLPEGSVSLSEWTVYLADERIVPPGDADCNADEIESRVSCKVVRIDHTLAPLECAIDYERRLVADIGAQPRFDAVLLGLGPDGHTCSLFPSHPLLEESAKRVASLEDSPKPPPRRVTLTLPVLNGARAAVFMCTGEGKAKVVQDILENPDSILPGAKVRPTDGSLHWFLDEGAASSLSKEQIAK